MGTNPSTSAGGDEAGRKKSRRTAMARHGLPVVVGLLGVALSITTWRVLLAREEELQQTRFAGDAEERVQAIQHQFEEHFGAVYALVAFYAGSVEVERDEFQEFTEPLFRHYQGVESLQWVPQVSTSQRAAFEAAASLELGREYRIRDRSPAGLVLSGQRSEHFPILFVEPLRGSEYPLGLDWNASPAPQAALQRAAAEGTMIVSEADATPADARPTVQLFAPIYQRGEPTQTAEQRIDSLQGFAVGVFRIDGIVQDALARFSPAGLDIYLVDRSAAQPRVLHASGSPLRHGKFQPDPAAYAAKSEALRHEQTVQLGGRSWTFYVVPAANHWAGQGKWGPPAALGGGLVITALIVISLTMLLRRTEYAEQIVDERTRELRESNRRLEEAIDAERKAFEALKQAQRHLIQTEKLAGLGQMVAGVAHEINNPLAFVGNNVAVIERDLKSIRQLLELYRQAEPLDREERGPLVEQIRDIAEGIDLDYTLANLDELTGRSREGLRRIQQIVKDLRDFARLDDSDLQAADVNEGIRSTVNIVQGRGKKKQVTVRLELQPMPLVHCYPAKINQVVMNLVVNAIDASRDGQEVVVRTRAVNGMAEIEVSDQGAGIPPKIRDRIFDPFFTTKPPGEGTGLGLSISYGIVQDHGGSIILDGDMPQGTRFVVRLPQRPPPKPRTDDSRAVVAAAG